MIQEQDTALPGTGVRAPRRPGTRCPATLSSRSMSREHQSEANVKHQAEQHSPGLDDLHRITGQRSRLTGPGPIEPVQESTDASYPRSGRS